MPYGRGLVLLLSDAVTRAKRKHVHTLLAVIGEVRVVEPSVWDELVGSGEVTTAVIHGPVWNGKDSLGSQQ